MLEMNWPAVITMLLQATTEPRISVGLISAKYTGIIIEAAPTPSPMTKRATIKNGMEGEAHIMMAPIVNRVSAMRITGLRPTLSERDPLKIAPTHAPACVSETMSSI